MVRQLREDYDIIKEEADAELICEMISKMQRRKYLGMHKNAITECKDGYFSTRLPVRENGRILSKTKYVRRSTRQALEDLIVEFYKEDETDPTIAEIFRMVQDEALEAGEIRKTTYSRYEREFKHYFSEMGERHIREVTRMEMVRFLQDTRAEYNLSAKAFGNLRGIVKQIVRYASEKELISYTVSEVIDLLNVRPKAFKSTKKKESEEVFSKEEARLMKEYLMDNPTGHNLGILLMFLTGLRVGELAALAWDDYESGENPVLHVHCTERTYTDDNGKEQCVVEETTKTDAGDRYIPLVPAAVGILERMQELNPNGKYIFMNDGHRIRAEYFRKKLYKNCEAIGIPKKSPHKIRKTFASILAEQGVNSKTIINIMGHTDIQTTEQYYERNRKTATEERSELMQISELFSNVGNIAM